MTPRQSRLKTDTEGRNRADFASRLYRLYEPTRVVGSPAVGGPSCPVPYSFLGPLKLCHGAIFSGGQAV